MHHARILEPLSSKALSSTARDLVGYGMPPSCHEILEGNDHEITLVFAHRLRRDQQISFAFSWRPSLVTADGKCRGEARLTLVSSPPLDTGFGAEFVRANIEAALQLTGSIQFHNFTIYCSSWVRLYLTLEGAIERRWQMRMTVWVPWFLTITTALVGVWQFSEKQAQANRQPFLEKQLEMSFEAVDAVATLASTGDQQTWERARETFWRLYWGPLSIVETKEVEAAMVQLGQMVPETNGPPRQLPFDELQGPSYKLAHAVREMVLDSWNVTMPELDRPQKVNDCHPAQR